jgi:Uma2 family endonuclease
MSGISVEQKRWTVHDLEHVPYAEGKRYEIIEGALFVSRQPHWHHQQTCLNIAQELNIWSHRTGLGQVSIAPGVLFGEEDDVAPDVVWVHHERLTTLMDSAGHLTGPPDLVVEVLSPGHQNEERDRQTKLALYSRRGVQEYWIADWRPQQVELYRRDQDTLRYVATRYVTDTIDSPLLPGFACPVKHFFKWS